VKLFKRRVSSGLPPFNPYYHQRNRGLPPIILFRIRLGKGI
jgi:hypothetical protein